VKGIFVAIGHIPNTGPFAPPLNVDEGGYFKPEPGSQVQTNVPGVYVAGDCSGSRLPPSHHGGRHGLPSCY